MLGEFIDFKHFSQNTYIGIILIHYIHLHSFIKTVAHIDAQK